MWILLTCMLHDVNNVIEMRMTLYLLTAVLQALLLYSSTVDGATELKIDGGSGRRQDFVPLGKSVSYTCTAFKVNPYDFVSLEWMFKSSESFPLAPVNSSDVYVGEVEVDKSNRERSLQIDRTAYWHDGYFYCVLQLRASRSETYEQLRVQGIPYIDTHRSTYPGPLDSTLGDYLNIVCYVQARPEAEVTWLKDGKELKDIGVSYSMESSTVPGANAIDMRNELSIYPLRREDLGVYTCMPINSKGRTIAKWVVTATPRLTLLKPKTSNATILYGYSFPFECEGTNFERTSKISWTFTDHTGSIQEMPGGIHDKYDITDWSTSQPITSSLSMHEMLFTNQGLYTCISGKLSASVYVQVVGKPVIASRMRTITALPGVKVTLTCSFRARPTPYYFGWYSGLKNVITGGRYYISKEFTGGLDNYISLEIHPVTLSDYSTLYTCKATNSRGTAQQSIKIKDVDECATGEHNCKTTQHEECQDTLGSYECPCAKQYERIDRVCTALKTTTYPGPTAPPDTAAPPGPTMTPAPTAPPVKSGPPPPQPQTSQAVAIGVGVAFAIVVVIIAIIVIFVICRRRIQKEREMPTAKDDPSAFYNAAYHVGNDDPHIYTDISPATDEFPRDRLRFLNLLGEGKFGRVVRAEALSISRSNVWEDVAVKMVKETSSDSVKEDFYHELMIVRKISRHPNVVAYLGCVTSSDPALMIMEYVNGGDLLTYLRKRRPGNGNDPRMQPDLAPKDFMSIALQAARGMAHIASLKIVHRDLAARNVLIDRKHVCKISDFGLSRDVEGADVYERTHRGPLPIRWMAPECLRDSIHTTSSDVWAFGVLLWEIVTLGSSPYPGLSGQQVMDHVVLGKRLPCPPQCTQQLYDIMTKCWNDEQTQRPTFDILSRDIERMLEQEGGYMQLDQLEEGIYHILEGERSEEKL